MGYTKGPWKVWKFARTDKPESIRQEVGTINEGTPICQLTGNEPNASLIASAPELFEACVTAFHFIDDDHSKPRADNALSKQTILTMIKYAINKAEGK